MNNNNLALANVPLWIKAAAFIGFPSVVTLVLLAAFLGIVPYPLGQISVVGLDNQRMLIAVVKDREFDRAILRQICRNTAKTSIQADRCDEVSRRD